MEFKFVQIVNWPRKPTASRSRSRFDSTFRDTLDLRAVSARQPVIIQTYMEECDIRNDGLPRSDARTPKSPGVIVTFEKWIPTGKVNQQGHRPGNWTPFSFPCDSFTDWKDNLRAIALSLEALRKVDRYGVTQNAEQYTGWKALPEVGGLQSDEEAAETLARLSRTGFTPRHVMLDPGIAKEVYRAACVVTHPDKPGGTFEAFNAVQTAWGRIKARHKIE